jgi:hypothetical protein
MSIYFKKMTVLGIIGFFSIAAMSQEMIDQDATSLQENIVIYEKSSVSLDVDNEIVIDNNIKALGDYKYSLDGSLASISIQSGVSFGGTKVVKNSDTGQIGLTNGQVIIKYKDGIDGGSIATDYGLNLIGTLPNINRITIQLSNLNKFTTLRSKLNSDNRVVSIELDVSYAPHRPE